MQDIIYTVYILFSTVKSFAKNRKFVKYRSYVKNLKFSKKRTIVKNRSSSQNNKFLFCPKPKFSEFAVKLSKI